MKKERKKENVVDGQNIVYHIIQKKIIQAFDADNPPAEVKFMIEQLLLWGGVWFTPKAYEQIPVLRPYVIRNSGCRNKDPKKDTWAQSNSKGLMQDDNTSIKDVPKHLPIISGWKEIRRKTIGLHWVASHVWMSMETRAEHACEWERTNSFIPNLVWLPKQLSKLTDRDGSYAQQFLKHLSYLLYSKIGNTNPMISGIWRELKDPGITPESTFSLDDLNYFDSDAKWINDKKASLHRELQSILDILNNPSATADSIYNDRYTSTLREASKMMSSIDKMNLEDWIKSNKNYIGGAPVISVAKSTIPKKRSTSATKISGKVRRLYRINGMGSYTMRQVIEEFIRFKLDSGATFDDICNQYSKGIKFLSDVPTGVSVASGPDAKPYTYIYGGKEYYITTQLKDSEPRDNFSKFKKKVNDNEPTFKIEAV